ncbi:MAG: hypothetical protein ABEJ43_06880 [Haloferacaceae archaeon]
MTALQSLRRAAGTLAGSPVLFVGGVATAAVVAPQTALSFVGNFGGEPLGGLAGLLGSALSILTFFVTPLIVAGTLGMAREALDEGRTSLDTFTGVARDRYVSLLLGFLLRVGLSLALGLVAAIVVFAGLVVLLFVVGVGASVGAGGGPGAILDAVGVGALALGALVLLVAALVFYVPLFFVQFFHVSVVTERAGAVDAFKRSFRAVRQNLLSSLGFTAVNFLVGVLPTAPLFAWVGLRLWERVQSPGFTPTGGFTLFSTTEVLALTAVVLVAQVVVATFQYTYATAFYGSVSEADPAGGDDPTTGAGTDDGPGPAEFETEPDAGGTGASAAARDPDADTAAGGGEGSRWAPDDGAGPDADSDDQRAGDR